MIAQNPATPITENRVPSPKRTTGARSKRKETFYLIISTAALIVVIAGFFPTYISPVMKGSFVAKPFVHLHGFIFFTWILIGIIQPLLVKTGNIRVHRKVGVLFGLFAIAVVGIGVTMAIVSAQVDIANGETDRPRAFLLIPLTDMLLFTVFVSLALFYYKRPDNHKRLMLLATISILPAAFARFLGGIGLNNIVIVVLITNSFVFAGIIYDFFKKRPLSAVYLYGGMCLLFIHFSRIFLSQTAGWKSAADWLLRQ